MWERLWQRRFNYDLAQASEVQFYEKLPEDNSLAHLFCDIDKTYLETQFETIVQLARIAFEDADQKITVPGAQEFLRQYRWSQIENHLGPRPLHFVSSSPPQLRSVFEEKLKLDNLDWTSLSLKNQAYNLRKGRLNMLRQHAAFKTFSLLNVLTKLPAQTSVFFIGDNVELDAFIYLGVALMSTKEFSIDDFRAYLKIIGAPVDTLPSLLSLAEKLKPVKIGGIFIRIVPGCRNIVDVQECFPYVVLFDSFFDLGLRFASGGFFDHLAIWALLRSMHNIQGVPLSYFLTLLNSYHECFTLKQDEKGLIVLKEVYQLFNKSVVNYPVKEVELNSHRIHEMLPSLTSTHHQTATALLLWVEDYMKRTQKD